MKMTILEVQTRVIEIIGEIDTNIQHLQAIREEAKRLIQDMGED